ncbi:MAG: RNA 2',3'-cyclic phosphodiesterase [Acidobacteriota bacterium]
MIRAFVAVDIGPEIRERLRAVAHSLAELDADLKIVAVDSIHLTLKFLGNVNDEMVQDLGAILAAAARSVEPFELRAETLGAFPNSRAPRVVWIGIAGGLVALRSLYEQVEAGCVRLGLAPETREYKPHLTLARVRGRKNLKGLSDYITISGPGMTLGCCEVSSLYLYQSQLRPRGAVYSKLVSCPLGRP